MNSVKSKLLSSIVLLSSVLLMSSTWKTNFSKAKEEAKKCNKYILLNFSGSDWCVPCRRTTKEIFNSELFTRFADTNLILVNADFPRLKKNKISNEQVRENEALAELYDKDGSFPLTLLFDANGKILKEWKGYPGVTPEAFIDQIKRAEH